MNALIEKIEKSYMKKNLPTVRVGDTVRFDVKIVEGKSERIQAFEGVVISRKGRGVSETVTVRKVSFGVGIERTFPLNSPRLEKIKVIKSGKVRRAKLYYLRNLSGKSARIQEDASKGNTAKETKTKKTSEDASSTSKKNLEPVGAPNAG